MNAASKVEPGMASELVRHRFTLEQYEKMVEDGILTSDDRVELLDGEIVEKMPIGSRHYACVRNIQRMLFRLLGDDAAIVSIQSPVGLPPRSEPEPDIALLRPKADNYASLHPRPHDVLLVAEVADSTLRRDRAKLRIYAEAGIPEAWVVDVNRNVVEVYAEPEGGRYRATSTAEREGTLTPLAFPDLAVAVNDVLP
jgi:Uma2 family endonuclease